MTTALGVQLYSVREDLGPEVLADTLKRLAGMGFTHVEPYDVLGYTDALQAAMDAAGLVSRTAHANIVDPKLDRDAIVSAAKQLGIDTIIVPWVQPESIADRAGVEALAAAINDAAEYAAPHGVRIGYHNHDFEFSQHIDGRGAYELLVELLADNVILEVDTYWASVGGADVFELLPRLGDRVHFLHVKTEPPNPPDRPMLGVDITGRLAEVLAIAPGSVELPIVEAVVHSGDIFPVLERNAEFFLTTLSRERA
ncbi:MAG TPA: sugar phosphate isomerase/epimerase [Pseudonocardiaceae bacterium]|nr:sugar phosphate isomerase/epimerase [Pseudonocardiaceae bacterium]